MRDIVFVCSIGFLAAWTLLSVWGLIQALAVYDRHLCFGRCIRSGASNSGSAAVDIARRDTIQHC